jgi:hypothetical protein
VPPFVSGLTTIVAVHVHMSSGSLPMRCGVMRLGNRPPPASAGSCLRSCSH